STYCGSLARRASYSIPIRATPPRRNGLRRPGRCSRQLETLGDDVTPEAEEFLRRAIALAAAAREAGDPPFGSLLVGPDGTVLAEDHNTTISEGNISFHPELKLAV